MKKVDLKVGMKVRVGVGTYSSGEEGYILSDDVAWFEKSGRRWATEYYLDPNHSFQRRRPKVAIAKRGRGFSQYGDDAQPQWVPAIVTLSQIMPHEKWERDVEAAKQQRIKDAETKAAKEAAKNLAYATFNRRIARITGDEAVRVREGRWDSEWTISSKDLEKLLTAAEGPIKLLRDMGDPNV